MTALLIVLVALSAGFAGTGFYAWRQTVLTYKMVCEVLDDQRKAPEPPVALLAPPLEPISTSVALLPVRSISPSPAKFLTKDERRVMIKEKENDSEFQKTIEEINERRRKYLSQFKPSRRFNPGQVFKPGQPLKDTEGLEPLFVPEEK